MTNETWLEGEEDFAWLREVHGVNTEGMVGAILHGSEDAPDKVELWKVNRYDRKPDRVVTFNKSR